MGDRQQVQANVRRQIREFLATRRERLTPDQVGLPVYGGTRRVKGLRREEVAALAGISVEYYIRLERGDAFGASDPVLEGIAHALRLDDAERAHLIDLVRRSGGRLQCDVTTRATLRPTMQRILDSMTTTPALVYNGRLDVLGANALGRALYEPILSNPPANTARFAFLDPAARTFWRDWETIAGDTADLLRAEAGRNPCDHELTALVGELSTRSEEFRAGWARHDVRRHTSGVKRIHHPVVGDLDLAYEVTHLDTDPGHVLLMYTPEPGSPTEEALRLLGDWTTTQRVSRP